ncbi:hypothetical protein BVG19_g1743 [[Candida] boidinii]|nr:hypothetical protein BVG19_g1743 [[Candida] boidinii]OWB50052.1 hypothetical protein B5S27_g1598 [[Candida] boidinii]
MSNLLHIPLLKTDRIDLSSILRKIIDEEFLQTSVSFENDIKTISSSRNLIVDLSPDTVGLENLDSYYQQLEIIESKFPSDLIDFPWYGTLGYRVTGPFAIRSLEYERINIIYCMASVYSHLGCNYSSDSENGLKIACQRFQEAAGCFEFIITILQSFEKKNKLGNVAIPLELRHETILALKYLMLAQAQETIWKKSVIDNMKDSVISKLSMGISDLYNSCYISANKTVSFTKKWLNHIKVKRYHFSSASYYRRSLVEVSAGNFGLEIGYLKSAASEIKNIINIKESDVSLPNTIADVKNLSQVINNTLRVSERDNDLIHLQLIPSRNELPLVEKVVLVKENLVKALRPVSGAAISEKKLFDSLLPFIIIQSAQSFKERLEEYVEKNIKDELINLNKGLNTFITENKIQSTIDLMQKTNSLPESKLEHMEEINSLGGTKYLFNGMNDLNNFRNQADSLLKGCWEKLNVEAKEDEFLRSKFGPERWISSPSAHVSQGITNKLKKLGNYLSEAEIGDKTIHRRIVEMEPLLKIYANGEESLKSFMFNVSNDNSEEENYSEEDESKNIKKRQVVQEIKTVIQECKKMEEVRKTYIQNVESKARNFSILSKIITEYNKLKQEFGTNKIRITDLIFEPVLHASIKELDSDVAFVRAEVEKQQEICDHLASLNSLFLKLQESEEQKYKLISQRRQKVLQKLEEVYKDYIETIDNIKQGCNFYNEFLGRVFTISKECDDFIRVKRVEARDLEAKLSSSYQTNSEAKPDFNRDDEYPDYSGKKSADNIETVAPIPAVIGPKPVLPGGFPTSGKEDSRKKGLWNPGMGINFG